MANVAITCPKKVTFPKKQPFYLFALLVTPCPLEGFVTLMSTGNSGALAEMTNAVFLLLRGQSPMLPGKPNSQEVTPNNEVNHATFSEAEAGCWCTKLLVTEKTVESAGENMG